jgi:hypothetical protein
MNEIIMSEQTAEFFYVCTNKRCRDQHVLVHSTLSPREYRAMTGRFISCGTCGAIMLYKGGGLG